MGSGDDLSSVWVFDGNALEVRFWPLPSPVVRSHGFHLALDALGEELVMPREPEVEQARAGPGQFIRDRRMELGHESGCGRRTVQRRVVLLS